jgi:hypothetical protein
MGEHMNRRLKAKIIEHYGTQFAFAGKIGRPESLVSKVVRKRRILSPEDRRRWAAMLKCRPEDVFGEAMR